VNQRLKQAMCLATGGTPLCLGVKGSRPGRTGVTVLPRGDTGDLKRAPAILQGW
jgi:hypothetical protein